MNKLLVILLLLVCPCIMQAQVYPEMIAVEGGTFTMGNEFAEGEFYEKPVHSVSLSGYEIAKTPVTVAQWKYYCKETGTSLPEAPSWGWQDDHPMVNINWYDIVAYCTWLSGKTGKKFRAPTEAEWEYAARGGNKSKGLLYSGTANISEVGWYKENAGGTTKPVAQKLPNELGLYDMSGNVWEYCSDWMDANYYKTSPANDPKGPATGSYHVIRGGNFAYDAKYCRVAARMHETPGFSGINMGLRLAADKADAGKHAFEVADIIQTNMVVQQDKPFRVWGRAAAGEKITVKNSWLKETVVLQADSKGEWWGEINVPKAKPGDFTAHTLSVATKDTNIQFSNLLIGEVWLCSGQSNMEMTMFPIIPWHEGVENYEQEIGAANHPNIRLVTFKREGKPVPQFHSTGKWELCSPQSVPEFSGTAYYFGKMLQDKLNVPVGLVVSAYGGSSCQAWTNKEVLAADPVLKAYYLDKYEGDTITIECLRPYTLYNSMIYPVRHLSIRGFLWDQGASNGGDGSLYTAVNAAMLAGWRSDFGQGDLPFYFVQGCSFNFSGRNTPDYYEYAIFKEAQDKVQAVKNTAMIVPSDLGETTVIHPRRKKPIGERLALTALANTYDKPVKWQGPRFQRMLIADNSITISYEPESIGGGLTTSDGQSPKHFFIAGADKKFYPATVQVVHNQVKLSSLKVTNPVAVRYAFTNYPVTNFCNKAGLPAYPFRTDNWK
jgi:sialate O-acetylesterase